MRFKDLRATANLIGISVGEVPSAASALPSRAAAFMRAWRKSWMVCGGGCNVRVSLTRHSAVAGSV